MRRLIPREGNEAVTAHVSAFRRDTALVLEDRAVGPTAQVMVQIGAGAL